VRYNTDNVEPELTVRYWRSLMKKFSKVAWIGAYVVLLSWCGSCIAEEKAESKKPVAASGSEEADHDALRALVPLYERAANEGKPELLKPYLDPDFGGVMVTGDEVDGFASLQEFWANIQKMIGDGGRYHVKVNVAARSILSGDLAVAHGTTEDDVVTANGKKYHFEGRWTAVCRKKDGQWKVLRVHGSMNPISNPFVMAALRVSSLTAGAIAGIVCLIVGWGVHVLWSRRRKAVGNAK
jgi:ketosteroid isomerase-like protein